MLSSLSARLHTLVRDVESYTLLSPVQRVAGYLADLIEPLADGNTVRLPAAKKVIASRLGMTPEAFSRALRDSRAWLSRWLVWGAAAVLIALGLRRLLLL